MKEYDETEAVKRAEKMLDILMDILDSDGYFHPMEQAIHDTVAYILQLSDYCPVSII